MAIEPTRRRRIQGSSASKYKSGVQLAKYSPPALPEDPCTCDRNSDTRKYGELTHQYPYRDVNGKRLFSRFRYTVATPETFSGKVDKTFRYCPHYDRTSATYKAMLYGLPRVEEAVKRGVKRIYLVEGEGDCEATWALADEYATTTHLGRDFPLEAAEHLRGYQGTVYIVVDRDHLDPDHQARFNHANEDKRQDYPGAVSALRKWRTLRKVGVRSFFREAASGKDLRDHLEDGKTVDQLRKIDLETIKKRAPKEANNKRVGTMLLSDSDKPEGPGMARFVQALEAKGFYLEKIGATRYKTNCPHPDHDDSNPSFEFEQGAKGVVATCESGECTVGKGMSEMCKNLGLRVKDLFDVSQDKAKGPTRLDLSTGDAQYCPDPSDPMMVARHIQDEWEHPGDSAVGVLFTGEELWVHDDTRWTFASDGQIRSRLYRRMDREMTLKLRNEEWVPVRWAPSPAKIGALLDAVRAVNYSGPLPEAGTWMSPPEYPTRHVALSNGIFDIERRELREHTPRYFNTWSLPFEYAIKAECPTWLGFLEDVFEGDPESIRSLQQWFGYLISGRTDLEKVLAVVGPTRSGKGTIVEMLEQVMGVNSYASFTLRSLVTEFGLQNTLGKSVMIAPDLRNSLRADEMQTAIELLLRISANDQVRVNRKNMKPLDTKLGVRIVMMSNELPAFMDSSNAMNSRIVMLKMRKSFLGREDETLKRRLRDEVQGVFNWALEGLEDLNKAGKFIQPSSAQNYIDTMDEGASPHEQFLSASCDIGAPGDPDYWCYHPELVQMWKSYCEGNDMKPGNPNWLPRKLAPVVTRLGGELGKGAYTDESGTSFRTITGIRIKQSTGPKEKIL